MAISRLQPACGSLLQTACGPSGWKTEVNNCRGVDRFRPKPLMRDGLPQHARAGPVRERCPSGAEVFADQPATVNVPGCPTAADAAGRLRSTSRKTTD
jgi:hypothetical protein